MLKQKAIIMSSKYSKVGSGTVRRKVTFLQFSASVARGLHWSIPSRDLNEANHIGLRHSHTTITYRLLGDLGYFTTDSEHSHSDIEFRAPILTYFVWRGGESSSPSYTSHFNFLLAGLKSIRLVVRYNADANLYFSRPDNGMTLHPLSPNRAPLRPKVVRIKRGSSVSHAHTERG